MCVIRLLWSYLCVIISDVVRKQGLRSTHKMRKPEEGIVIQSGDFSFWELFITMRPLWRRWPCATNYQESPSGNWAGRLSHFHYNPPLLVTIRGRLDELHIKSGDRRTGASKNQLRKCTERAKWKWWPMSGFTMQPPIANMLEGGRGRSSTQSSLLWNIRKILSGAWGSRSLLSF